MKRPLLPLLLLSGSLLTAGYLFGQAKSPAAAPDPTTAAQSKLVRVASLNTVQANQEFQANVQLLQRQRQLVIELSAAAEKEKDAAKKKELKAQVEKTLAQLNDNNDKMQKAYGFSLTRNYTLEIEVAHVYLQATPEEAAKIEQAAQQAQKASKK
jgi:hypothetical protein